MLRDATYPSRGTLLAARGPGACGLGGAAAPILNLRLSPSAGGRTASPRNGALPSLQAGGLAEWKSVVGETFRLTGPDGSHALKVVAVTAFAASGPRPATLGRSEAFSVVFESLGGSPLPATDRLYELAHRAYPSPPISMGAPTRIGRKVRLSAVFN